MSDPNFQGVGFDPNADIRQKLQFIIDKVVPSVTTDLAGTSTALSANNILNTYFSAIKTDPGKATPFTIDSFFFGIRTFTGGTPATDFHTDPIYTAMLNDFENIIGATNGDLPQNLINAGFTPQTLFDKTFNEFLQTYVTVPSTDPSVPQNTRDFGDLTYFLNQWSQYLSKVSSIQTENALTGPSFKDIYDAYFADNTTAFNDRVLALVQQIVSQQGYFLPSHHLGDFLNAISTAYAQAADSQKLGITSPNQTAIIDRILRLLIDLIDTVQQVATAQANRLTVLTAWQKDYTNVMGEVQSFDKNSPNDPAARLTDDNRKSLNDANNIYTPALQSYREVISDDSKALQSAINSSQDTVQNEASNVSSFIQELSSILGAIYR